MKKFLQRFAVVIIALVAVFGIFAPRSFAANGEYSKPECEGLFQDLTCTSLDHIAAFMTLAYEVFVDQFLEIDPATFDYEYVGSPGHALHTAWNSVRNLANIAFAILLFIVVLSQVTGIGISNYGIKKMLPRMVAGILMINLSYFICQGAIDLSNIFGAGLGSMFEDLMIDSIPPDISFEVGGSTALTTVIVAVVSFLVIKAKGLGTKIILLIILGILAILLAVFLLFVIAVVRQALCILLVVFAPIAFICYMLPGTKSIYNKWFSMFKGVLFAYPICSLMVYGGSYAGAVIYATWADNGELGEVLRNLSFLLITTVPYFFIPSVIMKSLGAAESAVARLNGFLQKNGRGALGRTRFMTDLNRRADQDQQLARAGYKRTRDGQIVPKKQTINASDSKAKKFAKRAYNASLRARDKIVPTAPYVKNAIRIQSEERRANAYRKKLSDMEAKERSNFYVFNAATGRYERVVTPLTNRQIRKGMYGGKRLYRAKVDNPNTSIGSTDFEHTSEGELSRVKASIRAERAKLEAKRFSDIESQEQNLESAAWRAQVKNDNMNVTQISEAMKKIAADAKTMNPVQLSAYASALVADGMAGRDALEALLADKDMQMNVDAIKKIATGMTAAELNSIKKKNPILHNKIMAIRDDEHGTFNVGDLSVDKNFAITEKQLDGLSPKHIAEMDASAQKRVVENLLAAVSEDATNVNSFRAVKALELVEGALNNPEIRATMSPEQVSNLEQIRNLRRTAVEAESAKTMRSDRQALAAAGTDYSTVSGNDVGEKFREDFKNTFLQETSNPNGNTNVITALTGGCDTTRMESITRAANAQLDEILRGKGLSGEALVAAREDIMRGVIEDMDNALRQKSKQMLDALKASEDAAIASMQAAGASEEEIAKRKLEKKDKMAAERYRLGASRTLCDVITQRMDMRS